MTMPVVKYIISKNTQKIYMKKFLLTFAFVVLMFPILLAQERVYMMSTSGTVGIPTPSDNDSEFIYNSSKGIYELTTLMNKNAFQFYIKGSGDNITTITPSSVFRIITFSDSNKWPNSEDQDNSVIYGGTGRWYVSYFPDNTQTATVKISLNLSMMEVNFVVQEEVYQSPEKVYFWGSENGGMNFTMKGEMTPDKSKPYLFSITLDVPKIDHLDLEDPGFRPGENTPDGGYYFFLNTNKSSLTGGTIFNAPLEKRVIDINKGDTYDVTLTRGAGATLICLSSGKLTFTFNGESLALSVAYSSSDTPSGVEAICDSQEEEVIYNLQGVPVNGASLTKGIYIVNGKKYVVK